MANNRVFLNWKLNLLRLEIEGTIRDIETVVTILANSKKQQKELVSR